MKIRNLKHNGADGFTCELDHPDLGWIPFSSMPGDPDVPSQALYEAILRGQYGEPAPFERRAVTVQDLQEEFEKIWPDVALGLADSETIQLAKNLRLQIKAMS